VLNRHSSEQETSLIPASWLAFTAGSNNGLALIARSMFDFFQDPSNDSTPSTNNEAPDARPTTVAPEVEPTSFSSIAATSTTQKAPISTVATRSTVDVPRPSSDQPKAAEPNWWRFQDWLRPRAIVPVQEHSGSLMPIATHPTTHSPVETAPLTRPAEKGSQ
jgi:hypothetical protein